MKESTLLRIALSFSLLGLITLFAITQGIKPEELKPDELMQAEEGRIVRIKGVVSGVKDYGKTAIIEVAHPKTTEVLLFKSSDLSLREGEFVEITGEISEYNGRKEVIASEVEVLT